MTRDLLINAIWALLLLALMAGSQSSPCANSTASATSAAAPASGAAKTFAPQKMPVERKLTTLGGCKATKDCALIFCRFTQNLEVQTVELGGKSMGKLLVFSTF